jgi:hypothetical protein
MAAEKMRDARSGYAFRQAWQRGSLSFAKCTVEHFMVDIGA